MAPDIIRAHATVAVLEDRIFELVRYRRWFRQNRWAEWTELRREYTVELRALLALRRKARDLSRPAEAMLDHAPDATYNDEDRPPYGAQSWDEVYREGWTEAESRMAFGDR